MIKQLSEAEAEVFTDQVNHEMELLTNDLLEFHSQYSPDAIAMVCATTLRNMLVNCDNEEGEIYDVSVNHSIEQVIEGIAKYTVRHEPSNARINELKKLIEKRYGKTK